MKRFFFGIVFGAFLLFTPAPSFAISFGNPLQGAFLSVFRNAQVVVEGARNQVLRFLGIRSNVPEAAPILRIAPLSDSSQFLVGTSEEIQWTYENLQESVTRIYLAPEGKSRLILMFLPARRNASGADTYSFPMRFDRGVYRIQVCNGETCDMTQPFSIVLPLLEEPPLILPESTSTLPFATSSVATSTFSHEEQTF